MIEDSFQVNGLTIQDGDYVGNIAKARAFIEYSLNQRGFSVKHIGNGYGRIIIGNFEHAFTPYGIDIEMMLEWLPQRLEDFNPAPLGIKALSSENIVAELPVDRVSCLSEAGGSEATTLCAII